MIIVLPFIQHKKTGHFPLVDHTEDGRSVKEGVKKQHIISVNESNAGRFYANCSLNLIGTKFSVRRYLTF